MEIDTKFDEESLKRIEEILLAHSVARRYFQGFLYDLRGSRLPKFNLERASGNVVELDEVSAGRLFMVPDDSVVWALSEWEGPGRPAGLAVQSRSPFLAHDEENMVVAFKEEIGPAVWLDALDVRRMMLAQSAPARMGTVAFGLMAITAYRLGFSYISLFAAGSGPVRLRDADAYIGYDVWPKFGFNAVIDPVDLNRFPTLNFGGCRSVQDIRERDPQWWTVNGSGRIMQFDLAARSRSWSILLKYLYNTLTEDPP